MAMSLVAMSLMALARYGQQRMFLTPPQQNRQIRPKINWAIALDDPKRPVATLSSCHPSTDDNQAIGQGLLWAMQGALRI